MEKTAVDIAKEVLVKAGVPAASRTGM